MRSPKTPQADGDGTSGWAIVIVGSDSRSSPA